ncbi:flavin-containing monooxygenase 5-like [Uloborus diversus]|uniref:flavin-containing monooxygenase 5-like n=1 Tax=Uloborus diversus TaxID=327109 RepID=UPI002409F7AA|nr:flavin-containing monooxygenase 5-like [Uloborus diversus]
MPKLEVSNELSTPSRPSIMMEPSRKRVAVIGGGSSGIVSIAQLKLEGIEPICFEKTGNFGGTWYYREETMEGVASIMPTTIINHSKEMGAWSDFPPRKEYSNYMRHNEMLQYITDYAEYFDCLRHIQYNKEVTEVKRSIDYEDTGRWIVSVRDNLTGEELSDVYDGVMICTGHINLPKMAIYPGQQHYKGKVMHTHSLKEVKDFKGQRVLVIGIGCSALDAAVEISSVAKQVYLSTRCGAYIMNRVGPGGYPIDYCLLRRHFLKHIDFFPIDLCSKFIEHFFLNPKFDYHLYTVKPKFHTLSKDPILNDQIGSKLLSGAVIQKGDVEYFTEDGVVFFGEKTPTEIDTVIMGTGYTWKFPFLEEGVLTKHRGVINLYKCMYPPQLKHSSLVFIGFINPFGPGFPLGELQCRWAAQVFAGNCKLPSEKKMLKDVKRRHKKNEKRYTPSEIMSIRVDFLQYMDEIAEQIGAKPNLTKYFFTDPRLFFKLWFGPCLSYQYRLRGPHKWECARKAIMTCKERMLWPLKNNAVILETSKFQGHFKAISEESVIKM